MLEREVRKKIGRYGFNLDDRRLDWNWIDVSRGFRGIKLRVEVGFFEIPRVVATSPWKS